VGGSWQQQHICGGPCEEPLILKSVCSYLVKIAHREGDVLSHAAVLGNDAQNHSATSQRAAQTAASMAMCQDLDSCSGKRQTACTTSARTPVRRVVAHEDLVWVTERGVLVAVDLSRHPLPCTCQCVAGFSAHITMKGLPVTMGSTTAGMPHRLRDLLSNRLALLASSARAAPTSSGLLLHSATSPTNSWRRQILAHSL